MVSRQRQKNEERPEANDQIDERCSLRRHQRRHEEGTNEHEHSETACLGRHCKRECENAERHEERPADTPDSAKLRAVESRQVECDSRAGSAEDD